MNPEMQKVHRSVIPELTLLETARQIGPSLTQYVAGEESARRLSPAVRNSLREAGLLKLFLPKDLGGFETDPVTTASVVEEIARHNVAAAWMMMVSNTSSWWCSRLPAKGAEEIYADGADTMLAGAFHPPMKALPTEGGYLVNGTCPLTSNVHEASWIFVTAFVYDGDQMRITNGIPEVIGVCMKASDCTIVDTWYTIGMKATDSNDVSAENVFVPTHRLFPLVPQFEPNKYFRGPLYQYPAIGASIACLISPVALSVATNAIEELKSIAAKKVPLGSAVSIRERGTVQRKLGMAMSFVQSSRAYLYKQISDAWEITLAGNQLSLEQRANFLLAVTHTNQTCFQATDLMYSAAGTTGIYKRSKLAHYFMDAQVIRHHGFSNEGRYETAAQLVLGLPPDLPVVLF